MFFSVVFSTIMTLHCLPSTTQSNLEDIKYFKNLSPITYNDSMIPKNKFTYSKVPTKLIKINKISN